MPNTIHIPTPLRPFTDKQESVEVNGATVGELLADLTKKYEGLRKHLYADDGRLRNFVNVYLNDEDIRYLEKEKTPVKVGDSLSIVPSVAGGAPTLTYADVQRHLAGRGGAAPSLADARAAVLAIRRSKSMVLDDPGDPNRRSCGSFFLNPIVDAAQADRVTARAADPGMPRWPQADGRVKLSAAWLIERAGFARGERAGAVGLSSRHTLAIVAHDGARTADVLAFARRVQDQVEQRFGVRLAPEPVIWGVA